MNLKPGTRERQTSSCARGSERGGKRQIEREKKGGRCTEHQGSSLGLHPTCTCEKGGKRHIERDRWSGRKEKIERDSNSETEMEREREGKRQRENERKRAGDVPNIKDQV